ncbi:MAG: type II toxin-antitoxin system RelE/ParE family toxin [Aulosira sp. DedQUE10]|nr:type II toxin-antitoxin system RelE/ParE family toxin [Aulosira sp. DedQUE10]
MNVYWTETAVENLSAIYAYIAQTSPQYAARVVDRITRRSQQYAISSKTILSVQGRGLTSIESYVSVWRITP